MIRVKDKILSLIDDIINRHGKSLYIYEINDNEGIMYIGDKKFAIDKSVYYKFERKTFTIVDETDRTEIKGDYDQFSEIQAVIQYISKKIGEISGYN